MLTFAQAKNSRLNRISGLCADSAEFAELLNDATRMLMRRGNFWGTVRRMRGCIYNDCIVWPRQAGTVLAVNRCHQPVPPANHWYSFDAVLPSDVIGHNTYGDHGCWGDLAIEDGGTTSVFNQVPCLQDRYLRFYPSQQADIGKTVTLFGIDGNGQVIRQQRSDGTYQDGVVLTLAEPYVQTAFLVRRVDRLLKDETVGPVRGYQWDGQTLYELGEYSAGETAPDYRQSRIRSGCCQSTNASCTPQLTALVKLAFVPVKFDDDLVLIENLDALAVAMQSVKQSDAYESDGAEKLMMRAVHELNLELRDRLPLDQTVVHFRPHGTARLEKQMIGRML